MARLGLEKHRKFLKLARGLNAVSSGMGDLLARGILETMWGAAYELADDWLGDADDVETVCMWRGEAGVLARLLFDAGFIELDQDRAGYRVHDLFDHAPPWVKVKATKKAEREAAGKTLSDVRREAGRAGRAKQMAVAVPATNGQTVGDLPGKKEQREGTGRDGKGITPVAPKGAANANSPRDWRRGIEQRWITATGVAGFGVSGLGEIADLVDKAAPALGMKPEALLERAIAEFRAWSATCQPGKQPPLTPRKLVEHWPHVAARITAAPSVKAADDFSEPPPFRREPPRKYDPPPPMPAELLPRGPEAA